MQISLDPGQRGGAILGKLLQPLVQHFDRDGIKRKYGNRDKGKQRVKIKHET
ncbi:hypothetical protein D3C81_2317040 [compost metagenome]